MMAMRLALIFSCLFSVAATAQEKPPAPAKSSAIPDRREFPLNPDVNPCQNFYGYVCSKVMDSFQLREDRSSHDFAFQDSSERLLKKKMDFFAGLAKRKTRSEREEGLKNYYLACMDEKDAASGEKAEVKRIKGIIDGMKSRDDLYAWVEKSYLSDETSPLDWGAVSNMDAPLKSDLYLVTDFTTLPEKSFYKKANVMADFKKLAVRFYKAIGEKQPEKQAQVLLKFESSLAEATPAPEEFRQIVNNRSFTTRQEILKKYPALRLESFLKEIPEQVVIRDWAPQTYQNMNDFLAKADLTDLKSVFLFHSLYPILDDGYPGFYKQRFEFNRKHFGGPNKRPPRQERCTQKEMRTFAKELDSILLPEIFPNFPREKVVALAEKIRASLLSSLEENTWLSRDAKKEAIEKMRKAHLYLVAPENEKQWDFLPQASYDPKAPLKNMKTVTRLFKQKEMKDLHEDSDPGRWGMGPLTVNAYYDASYNKFVLPIGILQYPFFDAKMPDEQNLAAMGSVIGHELGHGVDDQGSRYDADGKQRQWMTAKDLAEFSKRTNLLIAQFDGAGHNGHLTLGENIGDLVGVTASFSAAAKADPSFLKSIDRQKGFFEAYARLWCTVERPKFAETRLKVDPHSLGIARVNEQIKQQPAFHEAFQCKDGDPMVLPSDKIVHIW